MARQVRSIILLLARMCDDDHPSLSWPGDDEDPPYYEFSYARSVNHTKRI